MSGIEPLENDGQFEADIDVAAILDRYTLADVVEVTTRSLVRDGLPLPFSVPLETTKTKKARGAGTSPAKRLSPTEGVIHQLLGDYAI
mgnify:CR=1 FL=1